MSKDARMVLLAVSLLIMMGIVMIYSSSAVYAYGKYGDSLFFVKRHCIHLTLGLVAAVLCMSIPLPEIAAHSRQAMIVVVVLLTLVLIPGIGKEIGGARRWMRFLGIGIQPSEIAKIVFVVYLAGLAARKRYLIHDLKRGFLPPFLITGLMGVLILMEPDMGTAIAVLLIGLIMLFASGARIKHLAFVTAGVIPVLCLAVIAEPYRLKRIMVFLNPWSDARGSGFQLVQSTIALGSGGFFGLGLGESKQKLFYLPESHTDFIFSIIGEELGFTGAAFCVLLFAVLVWFTIRISFKIRDRFASCAVLGLGMMMAFEIIVNIGVSTGMLPTKGLPLPFISYGGSSLGCHLAAVGLILNMAKEAE
ncbi:MAG: putative lipid II flippase FtsW [Candidatus Omnitrophota bacterium]